MHLLKSGLLSPHTLEADLADASRAVAVRRAFIADAIARDSKGTIDPRASMAALPAGAFDFAGFYNSIQNTNCEAVIG